MLFISEFYFFVLLVLNFLFHFPVAGSELVYQVSFKSNSSVLIRYPRLLAKEAIEESLSYKRWRFISILRVKGLFLISIYKHL